MYVFILVLLGGVSVTPNVTHLVRVWDYTMNLLHKQQTYVMYVSYTERVGVLYT